MTQNSNKPPPATLADAEFNSPACSMHEADDVYMGFAPREELIAFLNELLAAERAGTKVATVSRSSTPETLGRFLSRLARDEARCCSMLAGHIAALGGVATTEVGAFYRSAMAIADIKLRLGFINHGQGSVVRRLKDMLPRIRDERLHADLQEMLRTHKRNIDLAKAALACT
jgi:hypothetical protein